MANEHRHLDDTSELHDDTPLGGNFFENLSSIDPTQEFFETLAHFPGVRLERIVSHGQSSEVYDQYWTEIVVIMSGEACLEIEGIAHHLKTGDWRVLSPHVRHRVVWTSREPACVWCAIHLGE